MKTIIYKFTHNPLMFINNSTQKTNLQVKGYKNKRLQLKLSQ